MTREQIDIFWQQALRESVEEGEMFTRYRFASLVAAHEREECARVCEVPEYDGYDMVPRAPRMARLIRARKDEV